MIRIEIKKKEVNKMKKIRSNMRKDLIIVSLAISVLAIFSMMGICLHEAMAQPPDYNKITTTGGDPETVLTVKIPKSVAAGETFTIQATVRCEEGEEYNGELLAHIVLPVPSFKSEDGDSEGYLDEDVLDEISEELEEMSPEEIEEAFESGEPIEVDTPNGKRYFIIWNVTLIVLKVKDTNQTLDIPLLSPDPGICFAFVDLYKIEEDEEPEPIVRIEMIPVITT
jgi:hypothetical protein